MRLYKRNKISLGGGLTPSLTKVENLSYIKVLVGIGNDNGNEGGTYLSTSAALASVIPVNKPTMARTAAIPYIGSASIYIIIECFPTEASSIMGLLNAFRKSNLRDVDWSSGWASPVNYLFNVSIKALGVNRTIKIEKLNEYNNYPYAKITLI